MLLQLISCIWRLATERNVAIGDGGYVAYVAFASWLNASIPCNAVHAVNAAEMQACALTLTQGIYAFDKGGI